MSRFINELANAEQYPQLEHWQDVLKSNTGGSHRAQLGRERAQGVIDAITQYLRVEIGDY